jgi:hypothetical protein
MRLISKLDLVEGPPGPITQVLKNYSIFGTPQVKQLDDQGDRKAERICGLASRNAAPVVDLIQMSGPLFCWSLTLALPFPIITSLVGAWLSLVERSVRDREVGGSNPLAPTRGFGKSSKVDHSRRVVFLLSAGQSMRET